MWWNGGAKSSDDFATPECKKPGVLAETGFDERF
jgi:hypothetical protein